MKLPPSIKPNKPSLVNWFLKHKVSSKLMGAKYAVRRAVIHEQLKQELNDIN